MEKQSFLSNLIGKANYHGFKEEYALVIFFIGTGLLAILTPLTFFCYWGILSSFLNLITGTSLLFIVYVAALIVLLDKEVKVETHSNSTIAKQKVKKPFTYKLTIVWGLFLVVGGIVAIYGTNKYRHSYAFQCKDVYVVNKGDKFYHLYDECSQCENAKYLYVAKGYQMEKAQIKLCPE